MAKNFNSYCVGNIKRCGWFINSYSMEHFDSKLSLSELLSSVWKIIWKYRKIYWSSDRYLCLQTLFLFYREATKFCLSFKEVPIWGFSKALQGLYELWGIWNKISVYNFVTRGRHAPHVWGAHVNFEVSCQVLAN